MGEITAYDEGSRAGLVRLVADAHLIDLRPYSRSGSIIDLRVSPMPQPRCEAIVISDAAVAMSAWD